MYKWKGVTARKVIDRFCIADNKLSASNEVNQLADKWEQASYLASALMDRFKVDINSESYKCELSANKCSDWTPGKLLDSCISIASTRKPVGI